MRILIAALLVSHSAVAQVPYSYAPENKRDPFEDLTPKVLPPTNGCDHSLCKVALSDLRLVGIVGNGPASVAMFENFQGTGLMAKRHARIGLRGGHVSEIARDCVTVIEQGSKVRLCISAATSSVHELLTDRVIPVP